MKIAYIGAVMTFGLTLGLAALPDQGILEAMLVADFAEYHRLRQVDIIDTGIGRGILFETLRYITTNFISYVAISSLIREQREFVMTERNSTTNSCDEYISRSSLSDRSSSPGLHLNTIKYKAKNSLRPLIIHPVYSSNDVASFMKLYTGSEVIAEWLLFSDGNFDVLLRQVYIPLNSKVTVATIDRKAKSADFWEVFQVTPDLPHKVRSLGNWTLKRNNRETATVLSETNGNTNTESSEDSGNTINTPGSPVYPANTQSSPPRRTWSVNDLRFGIMNSTADDLIVQRQDLTGLHLRCSTTYEEPYMHVTVDKDGTMNVDGRLGLVFQLLKKVTNFTSTCSLVKDGAWGSQKPDGRWTGMVGDLYEGRADVAIANLDITQQRSTAVDFLLGVDSEKYVLIMKRPTVSDQKWTAYTKQFQWRAWLVVLAFLAAMVALLYLTASSSSAETNLSASEAAFVITEIFLGQGTMTPMKSTSIRILVLTSLLFQVLLLAYYTSDLMSGLATGPPLPSISGLEDIAKHPDLSLGFTRNTALEDHLRKSLVPVHRQLYQTIRDRNYIDLMNSRDEGLGRVAVTKSYLYFASEAGFSYDYGRDCRFLKLPRPYFPTVMSLAVRKGAPFKAILNKVLLDTISTGITDKIWRDWSPEIADCNAYELSPFELSSVFTPLLLLGVAIFAAVAMLSIECLVWRYKEKRWNILSMDRF